MKADDFRHSLQTVIRNNSAAFGFSIVITGTLAAIAERHGSPRALEILGFGLAAVAAFTVLDVIATRGFRLHFSSEPPEVITHAASLSFVSVGVGLGAAIGIARVVDGWAAWPLGSFGATFLFLLIGGAELVAVEEVEEEDD